MVPLCFIHPGADHGEAKRRSLPPDVSLACLIIGILKFFIEFFQKIKNKAGFLNILQRIQNRLRLG